MFRPDSDIAVVVDKQCIQCILAIDNPRADEHRKHGNRYQKHNRVRCGSGFHLRPGGGLGAAPAGLPQARAVAA